MRTELLRPRSAPALPPGGERVVAAFKRLNRRKIQFSVEKYYESQFFHVTRRVVSTLGLEERGLAIWDEVRYAHRKRRRGEIQFVTSIPRACFVAGIIAVILRRTEKFYPAGRPRRAGYRYPSYHAGAGGLDHFLSRVYGVAAVEHRFVKFTRDVAFAYSAFCRRRKLSYIYRRGRTPV